jgi:hypothetical protein
MKYHFKKYPNARYTCVHRDGFVFLTFWFHLIILRKDEFHFLLAIGEMQRSDIKS